MAAGVLVLAFGHLYLSWHERVHHGAGSHFSASEPLEWIQQARAACLEAPDASCGALEELMEHGDVEAPGRDKVEWQVEHPGPVGQARYHYTLVTSESGGFEARATHVDGVEVWRIGPVGPPTMEVAPAEPPGGRLADVARALTLGALVLYLGALLELVRHRSTRIPSLGRRGWHAVAEVLCGLFMPVLLGLALLLIGSVLQR